MAKSKKSKILASMLAVSTMAVFYAAPVMAEDLSVTLDGQGIVAVGPDVTGTLTIAGGDIATALTDTNLTLNSVTANTISNTGNNFFVGTDGNVIANSVTTTGDVVAGTYSLKDIGVRTQNMTATEGDTSFTGNVSATGTMSAVSGDFGGTLNVTGDTTLAGLKAGATTVDSLTSTGNATVGGTLTATGLASLNGGLTVNGDTTLAGLTAGDTTVDSLTVKGAAAIDSLKVAKGIEAANGKFQLTEAGELTVGGKATFTDKVTVMNGLSVAGDTSVAGNFAVTNGGLSVSGESVLNGGLTVNNGDTILNGKLDVGAGNFKVDTAGNTEINGNLNIKHGNFTVDAATGDTVVKGSLKLGSLDGREVGEAITVLEEYAGKLQGANLPEKVGGIEREPEDAGDPGTGTTTIENGAEFTETAMTMGDTIVESGKITVGAAGNQTVIEGGAITTNTINAGGTIIDYVGMTVGSTVVNDSKITVGAADDQTIIEGGAITAKSLVLGTKDVGATIAGIERETVTDEFGTVNTTTIEGALKVSDNGLISNADGSFTVDSNGGLVAGGGTFAADITGITMKAPVQMTLQGDYNYKGQSVIDLGTTISDIDDRLDVLEDKTQNIKPGTGAGTGTGACGASGLTGGEGTGEPTIPVPPTDEEHTGITGDVTVGGEINAGEIVVGDKGSDNKTTIDGGNVTVNGGENGSTTINGGNITTGDTTIDGTGINTVNGNFTGDVDVDGKVTVGDGTTITGEGITTGTGTFDDVIIGENTTIDSDGINTNDITAGTGTIGNVDMDNTGITVGGGTTITEDTVTTDNIKADDGEFDSQVTVGDNTTITDGNINLGGDNGTNINADGMIVGNANGVNTNVSAGDVVITDKDGKDIALSDVGYVENIDRELQANGNYDGTVVGGINAEADIRRAEVNRLDNRISKVEDRVDKVGAMSAAIANLRTMGYDPAAPTEIAVGVGQYRSETGVALGMFHYPNKDFMLSLSVSTSGDEVMGGIGATWKFGRKSPEKVLAAEKEKAAKAKLAKAEAMKQAAKEAKIKAQQERHAKLAAERAAQAEAAK